MTHEYVIGLGGQIHAAPDAATEATAVAWAADHVLAVGTDDAVYSISRGDSTFLDLGGCVVTALPDDPDRANALVREASPRSAAELGALLIGDRLLDPGSGLETGSPADLAFWARESGFHLLAIVRAGAFIDGDEHMGPFPAPGDP